MSEILILPQNKFYVLEAVVDEKKEFSIHLEMKTAVLMVHEYIEKEVATNQITLTNISVMPKQLKAVGIPWSTIAVELIKAIKK